MRFKRLREALREGKIGEKRDRGRPKDDYDPVKALLRQQRAEEKAKRWLEWVEEKEKNPEEWQKSLRLRIIEYFGFREKSGFRCPLCGDVELNQYNWIIRRLQVIKSAHQLFERQIPPEIRNKMKDLAIDPRIVHLGLTANIHREEAILNPRPNRVVVAFCRRCAMQYLWMKVKVRAYEFRGIDLSLTRQDVGLTQKELAESCGWTRSYINKLENEQVATLNEEGMKKLQKVLGDRIIEFTTQVQPQKKRPESH